MFRKWRIFMATFIAVKVNHRMEYATKFQEILSKFGCNIRTRIGIHETSDNICSSDGVIILDVIGEINVINLLIAELSSIPELVVKTIEI